MYARDRDGIFHCLEAIRGRICIGRPVVILLNPSWCTGLSASKYHSVCCSRSSITFNTLT